MINSDVREDFCGVCAAIPIALAGAGVASITASKEDYKNRKNILIITSIAVIIFSIIVLIKYRKCDQCI